MSQQTRKCAACGCQKQVPQTMLMCPQHWFSVPKPLRDNVWRFYAAKQRGVSGAQEQHFGACVEAVKSIRP